MTNPNYGDTAERLEVVKIKRLGSLGELVAPSVTSGKIGPNSDSETEMNRAKMLVREVMHAPAGAFYKPLSGSNQLIRSCIDGRSPNKPSELELTANGAGGSIGLYFMILATGTMESMTDFTTQMQRANLPLGARDDCSEHSTGCGANDRFLDALEKMQNEASKNAIAGLRAGLGYGATTTDHDYIKTMHDFMSPTRGNKTAGQLAEERLAAIETAGGPESITHLEHQHDEIAAIWNTAADRATLDRAALSELATSAGLVKDNSAEMELLNVDAWAFEDAARKTLQAQYGAEFDDQGLLIKDPTSGKPTDYEVQQAVDFLIDYNLAATLVLCSDSLEVLHRQ